MIGTGKKKRNSLYLEKELLIGDWDMDTDGLKSVPHGLSDFSKIRNITVIIRNDAETEQQEISQLNAGFTIPPGSVSCDVDDIVMNREAANFFDNPDYSTPGFNRGWIYIQYAR